MGALTSLGSIYTYRSWECEKIESYDLFDACGSMVLYYVYGLAIVKVGPLFSVNSSEWCTDKIRFYIDCLNMYRLFDKISFKVYSVGFKTYSISVNLSWSYLLTYMSKFLYLFSISQSILRHKLSAFCRSSVICSYAELFHFYNFSKMISLSVLSVFTLFQFHSLWLYVGIYSMSNLFINLNICLIFFMSLISYSYPYIYIILKNILGVIFMVGVSQNTYINMACVGLGIFIYIYLFLFVFFDSLNKLVLYIGTSLLLSCYYSLCIYFLQYRHLVCSVLYRCLLLYHFNVNYKFKLHIRSILVYNMLKVFSILPLYGIFLFDLFSNSIMCYDQLFLNLYIIYDFDYIDMNNCSGSSICVFFTSYINYVLDSFDIILPMKLFIESLNFVIDYYGFLNISPSVVDMCSVYEVFNIIVSFMLYNINILVHMLYICYSIVTNYMCSLLYISEVFYFCGLLNLSFNTDIRLLFLLLFEFIFFYIYVVSLYVMYTYMSCTILKILNISYHSFMDVFLDSSTYFLTGSMCRMSTFIGRYRSLNGLYLYSFA